jgi:hypothetical protein
MRVTSAARRTLLTRLSRLARHDPRFHDLVGIELGGSLGRLDGDRFSDLDAFLYVDDDSLPVYLRGRMWELCDELGTYRIRRGPSFLPLLGWGFTADYDDAGFVQLFLRPRSDMGPTYLQATPASVEYDRDGSLAAVLAAARNLPVPAATLAGEAVAVIYFRAYLVAKEQVRGNDWQARKYFRELLESVLVLARLVHGVEPRGRYYRHSGRGMEKDLPSELATRLRQLDLAGTVALTSVVVDDALVLAGALCAELGGWSDVDWVRVRGDVAEVFAGPDPDV